MSGEGGKLKFLKSPATKAAIIAVVIIVVVKFGAKHFGGHVPLLGALASNM